MIPKNLPTNHAIIVLYLILTCTAISTPQMVGAKDISPSSSTTKVFNIYNTDVPGFNETKGVQKANLVSDEFSLQTIIVNQGDKVVVNFYNMEAPSGDRHSFTIIAPYKVDIDVLPGQNGTATFVADHPGVFQFACKYHYPSMVGQLMVLPHED